MDLLDVDTPEWVTVAEACRLTGLTRKRIAIWMQRGKLQRHRLGGARIAVDLARVRDLERDMRHHVKGG